MDQLSEKYAGFLLDAYGVFWNGNAAGLLPGAKELMEELVSSGKCVGVLSNATALSVKEKEKIARHGLIEGVHYHFYITSGDVFRGLLLERAFSPISRLNKFWVLSNRHPLYAPHHTLFDGTSYREVESPDEADFIYVGVPHLSGEEQINPDLFKDMVKEVAHRKLPMVCPNPDLFAHEGMPPRAVVRQGSLARLYKEMGGEVHYIGKPYDIVYKSALDHFRKLGLVDREQLLMVGDTPETDIRGGAAAGLHTALIMETGIMAERVQAKGLEEVLSTLHGEEKPHYYIKRFSNGI